MVWGLARLEEVPPAPRARTRPIRPNSKFCDGQERKASAQTFATSRATWAARFLRTGRKVRSVPSRTRADECACDENGISIMNPAETRAACAHHMQPMLRLESDF